MSSPVRSVAVSLCAAVWLTGMLAGCNAQEGSSSKSPSQVAVKVNKEEVSVHQVNDLLSRSGNIPQDQVARARSAVVERLIDQELLLQKAKESKLDRNPNVAQMVEFSRREILARAYSEQIASGAAQPTDAQISKFYDEHPELFSKRRVYSLQEINLQIPPERFDEVRAHLQSGGNLQQLTTWFNEQKIPFAVNAGMKPAEQLPLELARNLSQLNAGQAAFIRTPAGALLLFVVGVRDEPVDRARAKPAIENFLRNQARAESVRAEVKRLREAASINYVGDFAPPAAAEPTAPAEQGPVVSPETSSDDSVQSLIERGGIKLK
ncbi:MAG: EpsD family peptidyl-prolyl cis-trans isomerase [Azoarcus sp.]|nr:EpsD family peptidyl-prolyl cis-trans isomerase [Azoarcus sp.]